MNPPTIGLFGTCGPSKWRKPFLEAYAKAGLPYYNPQLEPGTWNPEMAKLENDHLYNDNIIIYVVTDETTAEGSLPEIGFALNGIAESAGTRYAIIFIDRECNDASASEKEKKNSRRTRELILSKLEQHYQANVFIAKSIEETLGLSLSVMTLAQTTHTLHSRYSTGQVKPA
jgi:hypothetical protein